MTKKELMENLMEVGVPYDPKMTIPELRALLMPYKKTNTASGSASPDRVVSMSKLAGMRKSDLVQVGSSMGIETP